jgi:hypothetical protein
MRAEGPRTTAGRAVVAIRRADWMEAQRAYGPVTGATEGARSHQMADRREAGA